MTQPATTASTRVFIHGAAGRVGATVAAELLRSQTAVQLILHDVDTARLAVQIMDLELLAALHGTCPVQAGSLTDSAASDVIIMAASVSHRDGAPRMEFLLQNRAILEQLLDTLPSGWAGALIIAANPVDPLCVLASRRLPHATVLGYSRNDSLRLSHAIAAELRYPPHAVTAWALGEHGPHLVPLFDRTTIDGHPIVLTEAQQTSVFDSVQNWYGTWQSYGTGLTSAWVTGAGIADLVARLLGSEPTMTTASIMAEGRYGIDGVSLGLPVLIGAGGAEPIEWRLLPEQLDLLRDAADVIASAVTAAVR